MPRMPPRAPKQAEKPRRSLIGMEKGKRNEIHQYEEDKKKGIVLIDEFKNILHTVCHFYAPLTLYREYTRMP